MAVAVVRLNSTGHLDNRTFSDILDVVFANDEIAAGNNHRTGLWVTSDAIVGHGEDDLNDEAEKWTDGLLRIHQGHAHLQRWEHSTCAIWGTYSLSRGALAEFNNGVDKPKFIDPHTLALGKKWLSPRAACAYGVAHGDGPEVRTLIESLTPRERARVVTTLIDNAPATAQDMRSIDGPCAVLSADTIRKAKAARPMPVTVRLRRLLTAIAEQTDYDCSEGVNPYSNWWNTAVWTARSESRGFREVRSLLDHLVEEGAVRKSDTGTISLTTSGLERAEVAEPQVADEIFVAMWFNKGNPESEAVRSRIKAAIRRAGYRAVVMDEQHHNQRIDDEILKRLRQARAVVADLLCEPEKPRASVYYEIGVAHGMGKEVVLTAPQDRNDEIAFDIRQVNQVRYDRSKLDGAPTGNEFVRRLSERLTATIGRGPLSVQKA